MVHSGGVREGRAYPAKGVIPANAGTQSLLMKRPAVYILASRRNGTLYTGVTASLVERIALHRDGGVAGFRRDYGVRTLVYYEWHPDVPAAIRREKLLKRWHRKWKIALIEEGNPYWRDLWVEIAAG